MLTDDHRQIQNLNTVSDTGQSLGTPSSILSPNGGGAICGSGAKFAANPVTGAGSMSVTIAAIPGRSGCIPQRSLPYAQAIQQRWGRY